MVTPQLPNVTPSGKDCQTLNRTCPSRVLSPFRSGSSHILLFSRQWTMRMATITSSYHRGVYGITAVYDATDSGTR